MEIKTYGDLKKLLEANGGELQIGKFKIRLNKNDVDFYLNYSFIGWTRFTDDQKLNNDEMNIIQDGIRHFLDHGSDEVTPPPPEPKEDDEPAMESISLLAHKLEVGEKENKISYLEGQVKAYEILFGNRSEINLK